MLLHLHIGIDKTGSTAVQQHMMVNRDWVHRKSIFVPITGSTPVGHALLFNNLLAQKFSALNGELKAAERFGFEHAFLSWEGICRSTADMLETLKELLENHEFRIYVYLREQSEIIQTGYFQNVKDSPQRVHIDDFRGNSPLMLPRDRHYDLMLDKFARAFGPESLRVRVYDRQLLKGNSIVTDMLDMLGLEPDDDFVTGSSQQNPSLDVASVRILNMLDTYYQEDVPGRSRLVDVLMNDIAVHGPVGKYFLSHEDLASIRKAYAESNRYVVERYMPCDWRYPDLFPYSKEACLDVDETTIDAGIQAKLAMLDGLKRFWTWNGKILEGKAVGQVAQLVDGWTNADEAGGCSRGNIATIRFRLMWRHRNFEHTKLTLTIAGQYHHNHRKTDVVINSESYGERDLSQLSIDVPLASLDAYGLVEIELSHLPSDGNASGNEIVSFCLARIGYTLGK
jgi:hypothetical protein